MSGESGFAILQETARRICEAKGRRLAECRRLLGVRVPAVADEPPHTAAQWLLALLVLIAEPRVGLRPGRIEPRARKRRPKPFPLLTRPRQEARDEVRRNGHPKKQR